jgi:hypothetical protein
MGFGGHTFRSILDRGPQFKNIGNFKTIWGHLNPWTRSSFGSFLPKWFYITWVEFPLSFILWFGALGVPSKTLSCRTYLTLSLFLVLDLHLNVFGPTYTLQPTRLLHFIGYSPLDPLHLKRPLALAPEAWLFFKEHSLILECSWRKSSSIVCHALRPRKKMSLILHCNEIKIQPDNWIWEITIQVFKLQGKYPS